VSEAYVCLEVVNRKNKLHLIISYLLLSSVLNTSRPYREIQIRFGDL